ncbi:hypothetical protein EON79_09050 [bacterium]|nr:MAG: hypothetical protein EON79_09050 [bacterium]
MDKPLRPGQPIPSRLVVGRTKGQAWFGLLAPLLVLCVYWYLTLRRPQSDYIFPALFTISNVLSFFSTLTSGQPRRFTVNFDDRTYEDVSGWGKPRVETGRLDEMNGLKFEPAFIGRYVTLSKWVGSSPPIGHAGFSQDQQARLVADLGAATGLGTLDPM